VKYVVVFVRRSKSLRQTYYTLRVLIIYIYSMFCILLIRDTLLILCSICMILLQIRFEHQSHVSDSYDLGRDCYRKLVKIHTLVAVVHIVDRQLPTKCDLS